MTPNKTEDAATGAPQTWTVERLHKALARNPMQLRRAILAVVEWLPRDQAYMTYIVGYLNGGGNRVPMGEHHGRCLTVMRAYLPALVVTINNKLAKAS